MKLSVFCAAAALALGLALPAAAHTTTYTATLSGPAEAPPNTSPGTGFASVEYDSDGHTFVITASFSGLVGPGGTSIAHIHCCTALPGESTAGVVISPPTLPGFPVGVLSGSYGPTLIDLTQSSVYGAAFLLANGNDVAAAEAALIAGMNSGRAYFNIHSTEFGSGEIRGFLAPVPEPETYALMLAGLGLVGWAASRRRKALA